MTHGMSWTTEWNAWRNMRRRCFNESDPLFHYYGARGITVCQRWLESFEAFYADMGPKPTPKHTLERIDNDGNYEPGNCRWATRKEQANNRRSRRQITHSGQTMGLKKWAEHAGMPLGTLWYRVCYLGWDIERALTTPIRGA